MKSHGNLIDIAPDAFHQPICFRNIGAVGSEINPCSHAVTDILGLVLVSVLLTLRKYVLHFGFRESHVKGV